MIMTSPELCFEMPLWSSHHYGSGNLIFKQDLVKRGYKN